MKKTPKLLVLLALVGTLLICGMMSASAYETDGTFFYTLTDGEITINGLEEHLTGDVVIPETIDGYSVTTIDSIGSSYIDIDSVYIPKNITTIDDCALYNYMLEKIIVDEENPYFSSDENGVLFDKEKTKLIQYPFASKTKEYIVPSTVKEIGYESMSNIPYLRKLTLPDGLEIIGKNAMAEYISVEELIIPDTVTRIESGALWGAHIISELRIPTSVEYIGEEGLGGTFVLPKDKIYIEGINTDLKDSYIGFLFLHAVGLDREEYRDYLELLRNHEKEPDSLTDEEIEKITKFDEKISDSIVEYDPPITAGTIYCHAGSTAETYAIENGVNYELTHFFKGEWSYDWENYVRTRKCIHCNELETEAIEPIDPETPDVPDEPVKETFIQKIINWFRDLFDKLFGWLKR